MKVATTKNNLRRSTPLYQKAVKNSTTAEQRPAEGFETKTLSDGLAICLFGFSQTTYDAEYEEEVRKQAVMSEVLPDAAMWKAWEATEAPLRQGRGWYPALDRHFLELLVVSEIHCLSHPRNGLGAQAGQSERIHRHASRVRRVACERIGAERLHAYCDRVKEAFEAYVHGAWASNVINADSGKSSPRSLGESTFSSEDDDESDSDGDEDMELHALSPTERANVAAEDQKTKAMFIADVPESVAAEEDAMDDAARGRSIERGEGSVKRFEHPDPGHNFNHPPRDTQANDNGLVKATHEASKVSQAPGSDPAESLDDKPTAPEGKEGLNPNDKMDVDDVTQIELDNSRAVEGVIENVVAAQMDEAIAPLHIRETVGEDKAMGKTAIVS